MFNQILDCDFTLSLRHIHGRNRYISQTIFYKTLSNGNKQLQSWLIYSKSANAIFCGPCKLFGQSQLFTTGFTDWSNAHQSVKDHESSLAHKTNVITFLKRSKFVNQIHAYLEKQISTEVQHWRDILKRVIAVIKALALRGLPFRGDDERSVRYIMGIILCF